MSENRLQIGYDCDGVLYRYQEMFTKLLCNADKITSREEETMNFSTNWKFYEEIDWDDDEYHMWMQWAIKKDLYCQEAISSTNARQLRDTQEHGDLSLVTARDFSNYPLDIRHYAFDQTHRWVADARNHGVSFRSVLILRNKTLAPVDIMLDDCAANCEDMLISGCMLPVLLNRPGNSESDYPLRVDSVEEYSAICEAAASYDDPFVEWIEPMISDVITKRKAARLVTT